MDAGHEILRRADRWTEESLGRPPRTPFAVRAATTPVEPRSGRRGTRLHRAALSVMPAALVEQHSGVDFTDVRRPLAAELHPGRLILGRDERKRASQLSHPGRAPDAMGQPVRGIGKLEVHDTGMLLDRSE